MDGMMTRRILLACLLGFPLLAAEKMPVLKQQEVTVGGQVKKPGPYPFRETSILAMVFTAGGPTEFAAMRRVKVLRKGRTITLDLTREEDKARQVEPGDSIEVPRMNLFGR